MNNNRPPPSCPGHKSRRSSFNQYKSNPNNDQRSSFFSNSRSNAGGSFDFNQLSQNISDSIQDICKDIDESLMDVKKMFKKNCNSCGTSFSIFSLKKRCHTCMLHYCNACMEMNHQRLHRCRRCLVFAEIPLTKDQLNTLRVRDLKWFLSNRNIPSDTYSEKGELVELIIATVNPPSRRGSYTFTASHLNSQQPPQSQARSQQPERTPSSSSSPTLSGQHTDQPNAFSSSPNLNTNSASSINEPNSTQASSLNSNLSVSTFNLNDIKGEEEIKELSIRQLKLILTRNFVDFKGCVEREELIQKAVLLWNDKQQTNKYKDENEDNFTIDEQICKICMENPIDCVLLECGHMLTCTDCGKVLSECPICRQFVVRVVHVFKA